MSEDRITQIIEEMVAEKTFNLEAADKVKELKETAAKMRSDLEESEEARQRLVNRNQGYSEENMELEEECATLRIENSRLKEIERKMEDTTLKAELTTQFETARRQDMFNLVGMIFKSPQMKTTIAEQSNGNVPVMGRDGYATTSYTSGSSTKVITNEEVDE